jgi:hypothetical protein
MIAEFLRKQFLFSFMLTFYLDFSLRLYLFSLVDLL